MVFDKDAFVQKNWKRLCLMSRNVSYKLHYKFKFVSYEDLYGYAMLGMMEAISHMDIANTAWPKYLYQYGYHRAYAGAMEMLGLVRSRTHEGERLAGVNIQFVEHEALLDMYDETMMVQSLTNVDMLSNIISKDSCRFLQKCLGDSLERQVFEYVIRYVKMEVIANKLNLSKQTVYRVVRRVSLIYKLACQNKPYQHLLRAPRMVLE